ncbi:hypothetical protein BKA93DRAFT_751378 [Sparassis latifolia]
MYLASPVFSSRVMQMAWQNESTSLRGCLPNGRTRDNSPSANGAQDTLILSEVHDTNSETNAPRKQLRHLGIVNTGGGGGVLNDPRSAWTSAARSSISSSKDMRVSDKGGRDVLATSVSVLDFGHWTGDTETWSSVNSEIRDGWRWVRVISLAAAGRIYKGNIPGIRSIVLDGSTNTCRGSQREAQRQHGIHVVDRRNFRPFHEYVPGIVESGDVETLMKDRQSEPWTMRPWATTYGSGLSSRANIGLWVVLAAQAPINGSNTMRGGAHENGSARKRAPAQKRALRGSPQGIEVGEEKGGDDGTGAEEGDGIDNDNGEEGMSEEEEADTAMEELAISQG